VEEKMLKKIQTMIAAFRELFLSMRRKIAPVVLSREALFSIPPRLRTLEALQAMEAHKVVLARLALLGLQGKVERLESRVYPAPPAPKARPARMATQDRADRTDFGVSQDPLVAVVPPGKLDLSGRRDRMAIQVLLDPSLSKAVTKRSSKKKSSVKRGSR